jgi:hypothetical protein
MDPLSAIASVIAVLQLTGTVIGFMKDTTGARDDRKRILEEFHGIHYLLFLLKDEVDRQLRGSTVSESIKQLQVPLQQFESALDRFAKKLKPAQGFKKLGKAMIWPFQKEDVKDILSTLERYKSLFNMALQNDHMYLSGYTPLRCSALSRVIQNDVREVNEKVTELQIGQKCTSQFIVNGFDAILDHEGQLRDQLAQDLMAWLSPLNFWVKQIDHLGRRQEGTGEWLLNAPEFKGWLEGRTNVLWCPGIRMSCFPTLFLIVTSWRR